MTFEEFILAHEQDDPAALLLARHRYPDIDLNLAVTTLEGRRRLRRKVPEWYALPALIYPTRLGPEQCSSSATARFKAALAAELAQSHGPGRSPAGDLLTLRTTLVQQPAAEGCCTQRVAEKGCCVRRTWPPPATGRGRGPTETSYRAAMTQETLGGAGANEVSGVPTHTAPFWSESAGLKIADLTGGLGVDCWAFSGVFGEVLYNEMDAKLAKAVEGNFEKLGVKNVVFRNREVVPGNVAEILGDFRPDVIFLDPARRADNGRKVFRLADCQPDVLQLLPELFAACPRILMKVSPMADITQLSRELPDLKAVWIVGAGGECKELLLVLEKPDAALPRPDTLLQPDTLPKPVESTPELYVAEVGLRHFVLDLQQLTYFTSPIIRESKLSNSLIHNGKLPQGGQQDGQQDGQQGGQQDHPQQPQPKLGQQPGQQPQPEPNPHPTLLFEPGKALAKAGRFREIERAFGLRQAAPSTHLYFGVEIPEILKPFGKTFRIEETLPLCNETFRSLKKKIPEAEISARNLPMSSELLRRKLGIASGGTQHLFGIRTGDGKSVLLVTSSADPSV